MEIMGFSDGMLEEVNEGWTKGQNGKSYTFGKQRKSQEHFVCYCQRDGISDGRFIQVSATRFETDRDLTRDGVEQQQQCVDFINGTK